MTLLNILRNKDNKEMWGFFPKRTKTCAIADKGFPGAPGPSRRLGCSGTVRAGFLLDPVGGVHALQGVSACRAATTWDLLDQLLGAGRMTPMPATPE